MSVTLVNKDKHPTYIALSSDITSGSIVGTPIIGGTVYVTDTQNWYIVVGSSGSAYALQPYVLPALEATP